MRLMSWREVILRSCWWVGAFLVGCASLSERDFQRVHCELWDESVTNRHALSLPYETIAKKPLPRMSTGKAFSEITVNNIEVYIQELDSICSGMNDAGEQD
ncbi:hypothetical protein KR100_12240 [Synechococcus sp. KORDI-100]|nr:hypothetical protein KR100_12240 [Synechococcus sp. KORDI-100]